MCRTLSPYHLISVSPHLSFQWMAPLNRVDLTPNPFYGIWEKTLRYEEESSKDRDQKLSI